MLREFVFNDVSSHSFIDTINESDCLPSIDESRSYFQTNRDEIEHDNDDDCHDELIRAAIDDFHVDRSQPTDEIFKNAFNELNRTDHSCSHTQSIDVSRDDMNKHNHVDHEYNAVF
jgi:hypothetical protein